MIDTQQTNCKKVTDFDYVEMEINNQTNKENNKKKINSYVIQTLKSNLGSEL